MSYFDATVKTTSLKILVLASVLQLLNQCSVIFWFNFEIGFFPTPTASSSIEDMCYRALAITDFFYFGFQVLSSSLLIIKATVLLPVHPTKQFRSRKVIRIGLFALLGFVWMAYFHASLMKVVSIERNICQAEYMPMSSAVGSLTLIVLYTLLLICFCAPLHTHLKYVASHGMEDSFNTLRKVLLDGAFRISFAVLGYVITTSISLAQLWGPYILISFTLQNYLCLLASTFTRDKTMPQSTPSLSRTSTIGRRATLQSPSTTLRRNSASSGITKLLSQIDSNVPPTIPTTIHSSILSP
jgi:hypothetical protein